MRMESPFERQSACVLVRCMASLHSEKIFPSKGRIVPARGWKAWWAPKRLLCWCAHGVAALCENFLSKGRNVPAREWKVVERQNACCGGALHGVAALCEDFQSKGEIVPARGWKAR